ncbi:Mitochondrial amidoxime reducing component 2 [Bienertia sinuspersici]
MITQRLEPKLALIEIELPQEAFLESWKPSMLRAPGMDMLKVSLSKPSDMVDHVSVWNWNGSALDEGENAAEWLSKYLSRTSRLVRFDSASQTRATDPNFADGYKTMFSDQFPFMVISQGSLDALNDILEEPIPINRFRPNILVEGCKPFSEDLWKEIKINKLTFYGVRLCSRCKIPSINQETGVPGSEPANTLKGFRSDAILLPNKKSQGQTYVGQHLVCKDCYTENMDKVIQVGDPVYVVQQLSSTAEAAA